MIIIFYCRSKLVFQHSSLEKYIKLLGVLSKRQIDKSCSFIIILKNYSGPFSTKKLVKKGYCGNGSLGLDWDRVRLS